MRRLAVPLSVPLVAAAVLLALSPAGARAEDPVESCHRVAPITLAALRVFVWSGTVTAIARGAHPSITFDVDRVYASLRGDFQSPVDQLVVGPGFHMANAHCVPLKGLTVGERYLVGAESLRPGPNATTTVVWRIDGSAVHLLHMWDVETQIDRRLPAARTLEDALRIVAPGADLPATDTEPRHPARPQGARISLLAAVALVSGLLAARRSRLRQQR